MKLSFQSMLFLLAFTLTANVVSAAEPLPEPELPKVNLPVPTFGDDTNVLLLARLIRDADPRVREQAVQGLGETHNPAALKHLEEAMSDNSILVRSAVVSAVTQYPEQPVAREIVIQALGETDPVLLQAAMTSVTRLDIQIASPRIAELLANPNANIRLMAVETLNKFGKKAENGRITKLLMDPSAPVRLAATQNAMLFDASPEITEALQQLAETTSTPAVQTGAIEALGKLAMETSEQIIAQAAESENPLLRRAAVRAYHQAGKVESVEPFLKDSSAMVRLAAIQAAGDLKSGQVETLNSLMLNAPAMQSHLAARKALLQNGSDAVAKLAADSMKKEMEKYLQQLKINKALAAGKKMSPPMERKEENLLRNVVSCCFILGELKSKHGFDYMLSMRKMVEIDSPILGELANSCGKIGDSKAIEPLIEILKKCKTRGKQYLVAIASMSPPPPFSVEVTSNIIEALADLKAYSAIDTISGVVSINHMGMRLPEPAGAAARAYVKLVQPDNRKKIEKSINEIIDDNAFGLTTRSHAIKTAAKMKIESAWPGIEKILTEERPTLLVMQTAAWAIQELTGQTPAIPQPVVKQGSWIIKQLMD